MRYLFTLALLLVPQLLVAQARPDSADGWDAARALELIARAQQRRAESGADTGLVNYQADARVYVYFYLDREDTGERNLVKTDQLALEVFWQEPDQVKQRIVGWRDEKSLPTNIHYHLDHLTVVQENFGDEIRLGDGDEVRGVLHPAAPGAEQFYEYRLADSLTLRLPGAPDPVQVYEVQVRPRNPAQPAFLGSVFIDRRAGDLVRMDFTFTAAAYVDRYLDHINISLDNGLWRGRFWLPNQQRVEIRRRIPMLDIPAGSVIRANMRVGNYRFNEPLAPLTFSGPAVTAAPREQREAYEFEQELHAELRTEGIGPQVELTEIRRRAAELAREQALRRVAGVRLSAPSASDVLRYNRAEGLVVGAGASLSPLPRLRARLQGGYAFGAEHPFGEVQLAARPGATRVQGSLYANRPRDVGVGPASSGVVNTLAALVAGRDYSDLYYATGGEFRVQRPVGSLWHLETSVRLESHASAEMGSTFSLLGGAFRPVQPVDETDRLAGGRVALRRDAPAEARAGWEASLALEAGTLSSAEEMECAPGARCVPPMQRSSFLKPQARVAWQRRWEPADARLTLSAAAGGAFGTLPRQELYLLGGKGTMPGYQFRGFGGDRFALAQATASAALWKPWVRGRALAALGWAGSGEASEPDLRRWGAEPTGAAMPSVGVGVGLLHDLLRVDIARGLGAGGRWELMVEGNPSFWDFL